MSVSRIQLWNLALDAVKEKPLATIDDDVSVARWLTRNYEPRRDALLRKHPWNFAKARASVPVSGVAPAYGWERQFALPADCLRLLPIRRDGELNAARVPYELESRMILTDATAPLKVRYIRKVTVEGEFESLFVECLALKLATHLAHWMTGKASLLNGLNAQFEKSYGEAKQVNAMEAGSHEKASTGTILDARYQRGSVVNR